MHRRLNTNNSLEELKQLPKEVQIDVAEHLDIYDEVTVTREYGKFSCMNWSCIKREYAQDYKVWFFDRETVMQDTELKQIILKGQKEYEDWCNNNDVDWSFMMA